MDVSTTVSIAGFALNALTLIVGGVWAIAKINHKLGQIETQISNTHDWVRDIDGKLEESVTRINDTISSVANKASEIAERTAKLEGRLNGPVKLHPRSD